jgi:high-affinity Fe2+/Pb2+ permease
LRAYLVTTGTLFGLIAAAHLARTIAESQRLASDPWFYLEGPGLGLVAAALSLWAWRLFCRAPKNSPGRGDDAP